MPERPHKYEVELSEDQRVSRVVSQRWVWEPAVTWCFPVSIVDIGYEGRRIRGSRVRGHAAR